MGKLEIIENVRTFINSLEQYENDKFDVSIENRILNDIKTNIRNNSEETIIVNDVLDLIGIVRENAFMEGLKAGVRIYKTLNE